MPLEERTEAPTQRRREEARKKGQVAKSIELSSALSVLATLMTLKMAGPSILARLKGICTESLSMWPVRDMDAVDVYALGIHALGESVTILAPMLLLGMLVAAVATAAQVGLVISGETLQPQLNRLDPVKGITRMFSKRAFVEGARSVAKVTVVGYILWVTLREEWPRLASLMNAPLLGAVEGVGIVGSKLVIRASLTILVIALFDYWFQRHSHEQDLKMTKSELKEDNKRSEGDPTTRARIRQIMREMARKRMMSDVQKADVIVTNPTHLAIALRYDSDQMTAPKVVAKGQRLVAERIVEIGKKHKIPVMQNIPLARSLFKSVDVGQEVPLELYQAVAELLAAVYRMKGHKV